MLYTYVVWFFFQSAELKYGLYLFFLFYPENNLNKEKNPHIILEDLQNYFLYLSSRINTM